MMRTILVALVLVPPAAAHAHGLSLEMSALYAGGNETAMRAFVDDATALGEIGLSGHVTLWRRGDWRGDAIAAWSMISSSASVAGEVETAFLEHAFVAGARVRWARLAWVQPFVSVRAGPAFGFFDAVGLEASDWAPRVEPAIGGEILVPFSAVTSPTAETPSRGGFGLGLGLGYRLQGDYDLRGERPDPDDPEVAKDAIPRDGTRFGALSASGWRLGLDLVVRF